MARRRFLMSKAGQHSRIVGADGLLRLYKYRPLSPPVERERTLRILSERKVYFARPSDFDDEHDCRPLLSFRATWTEKKNAYRRWIQEEEKLTRAQAQAKADAFFLSKGRQGTVEWEKERAEPLESKRERLGVFCVCEVNDSVQMWREYAADHNGICIELGPTQLVQVSFFGEFSHVEYQDGVPTIDLYHMRRSGGTLDGDCVVSSMFTKTARWSHEKEWRNVDMWGGPGEKQLPEGLISGVIIGARVSPDDRSLIHDLAAKRIPAPRMFRASLRADGAGIDIIPD